jgi:hypothetical protein
MTMRQITPQEFLDGVELGYISDIFAIGRRVYGKDPRGKAGSGQQYDVVWADIP